MNEDEKQKSFFDTLADSMREIMGSLREQLRALRQRERPLSDVENAGMGGRPDRKPTDDLRHHHGKRRMSHSLIHVAGTHSASQHVLDHVEDQHHDEHHDYHDELQRRSNEHHDEKKAADHDCPCHSPHEPTHEPMFAQLEAAR